jgi:dihydrodipicolinate synthase/N-acetylneuraminate lyase
MATSSGLTRRECLTTLAASMAGLPTLGLLAAAPTVGHSVTSTPAPAPATTSAKTVRGAFMILSTPFTKSGDVDWDDLTREVEFVDRCGCQGIVWPQGSSLVTTLTKDERLRGAEVLAKAITGKRAALVLGVQGANTAEMLDYASHAERLNPDALIAMPPSTGRTVQDYRDYFRALASLTNRPVIVQTSGGAPGLPPPVDLILELAREFPHLGYVKEESAPLIERMKSEIKARPPMRGVFGASNAQGWLYEMRLGLDGIITGEAMYADLMSKLWDFHERHQVVELREAYSKFLLMRNLIQQIPQTDLYILKKRGIFKTMTTRTIPKSLSSESSSSKAVVKQPAELSSDAIAEIEYRFAALQPYLLRGTTS